MNWARIGTLENTRIRDPEEILERRYRHNLAVDKVDLVLLYDGARMIT